MHDIDRTLTELGPEQQEMEAFDEIDALELADESDPYELADPEAYEPEMDAMEAPGTDLEGEPYEAEPLEAAYGDGEVEGRDLENPFTESEEIALAEELLGVGSDAELDQFLGKLFKRAFRGLRRVGSAVGRITRPLGGMLKGVAKSVLPVAAGAAGTFFGGPAGGAIGAKLGSMVGSALETELAGLGPEDRELEVARRFVRVAGTAARQAARVAPGVDPRGAARSAVVRAVRRHVPHLRRRGGVVPWEADARRQSGRWFRRGARIVLLDV